MIERRAEAATWGGTFRALAGSAVGQLGSIASVDTVQLLSDRIASALAEEAFQRDRDFLKPLLPLMRIWSAYFAGEVRGLERVPAGRPVLLVGNHSGGMLVPDTAVLIEAWYRAKGLDDPLTLLGMDTLFTIPGLAPLCRKLGLVPANSANAERALEAGHAVLVYPGGVVEAFRPWTERNRIDLAGRTGFVKLALRRGVPIVPVVAHGGHETLLVLSRGERLGRAMGMDRLRMPGYPVVLSVPWGLLPLPGLPLPAKITVEVGAPIAWPHHDAAAAADERVVTACYEEVAGRMQSMLDGLARARPRPLLERWLPSVVPAPVRTSRTHGYRPQERGPHVVGVRTVSLTDASRGRQLPVEVWYPAAAGPADEAAAGCGEFLEQMGGPTASDGRRDLPLLPGRSPLIVFSHGYSGHRRQSTFLCSHLASWGYVVAAPDHVGNTVAAVAWERLTGLADGWFGGDARARAVAGVEVSAAERPLDLLLVLERFVTGAVPPFQAAIDPHRTALMGHSFGGWAALVAAARDRSVAAVVALAPSGGRSPVYPGENPLTARLPADWTRDVPTLVVAAANDSILPLDGVRGLVARIPGQPRLVVLQDADHLHFLDRVDVMHELFRWLPKPPLYAGYLPPLPAAASLLPGDAAACVLRGLTLAHFDAHLRADPAAHEFLAGNLTERFAGIGAQVTVESASVPR